MTLNDLETPLMIDMDCPVLGLTVTHPLDRYSGVPNSQMFDN